jgi:integrase
LLDEGINIKIAQTRLGHANARTTLAVHAQATMQGDRGASDRLGERFRPRDGRGIARTTAKPQSGRQPS